jgi:hypothetical protein
MWIFGYTFGSGVRLISVTHRETAERLAKVAKQRWLGNPEWPFFAYDVWQE